MPSLSEVALQSVIAFVVLLVLARLMGKRQIAQLSFFDYIAGITIGDMAAAWSLDEVKTLPSLLTLVIWGALVIFLAWIEKKSYRIRQVLDGKPVPLVENGKLLEENLKKVQLSVDEMMILMRQKDVFNLSDAEYAVMENNGTISVSKKPELQFVTRKDLGILTVPESLPKFLVISGQVVEQNLKQLGHNREWLITQLQKMGVQDISSVFVAQMDSKGEIFVDKYEDLAVQPQSKEKPLLLASLKKDAADLEGFALETDNAAAKEEYQRLSREVQDVVRRMTPYLKG